MSADLRKQRCVEAIETAQAAGLDDPAITTCLDRLRAQLRDRVGGDMILIQLEKLLRAQNPARAIQLVAAVPFYSRWRVPMMMAAAAVVIAGTVITVHSLGHSGTTHPPATTAEAGPADTGPSLPEIAERLVGDFGTDVAAGRIDAAYARTSAGYRAMVALDKFRAVATNPYFTGFKSVTVTRSSSQGGAATAHGVLVSASGQVDLEIHLTQHDGEWGLVNLVAGGFPLLPAPP